MLRIFNSIRRFIHKINLITFKDKTAKVEVYNRYGSLDWAQRHPNVQHDLEASKVNANVYIATRAISDAIKSLPVDIKEVEIINGIERAVDNNDHPANELLQTPNTEHSWSDILDYTVKAYSNDGNAIFTIERMTGPNPRIEIWPRDPRNVDINTATRDYRFGKFTDNQRVYPRNRIIHIRDMDTTDPFWGIGRINTVREEIAMDYFVNRFNANFFKYGATLNLMFTPDHDLSEDQHMQIIDAMSAEIGGAERAFKIFINRFGGKFEYPDQKHKDIAFMDLLKHNREKIFGVFGLPPFRGGVMEYANYANALAQDKDFWLNTIAPILKVIEDAFNKQLLWPIYGTDIRLKFNLDSVPAMKGSQTEVEDRLLKLKAEGIVSASYVREQLGIEEDAAPETSNISKSDSNRQKEDAPKQDEEQEVKNALLKQFRSQRNEVLRNLAKLTSGGSILSALCDPETQALQLYGTILANKTIRNQLQPVLRKILMKRGLATFKGVGVFDMKNEMIESLMCRINFKIEDIVDQNVVMLKTILEEADKYNFDYLQLQKRLKSVFSLDRVHAITNEVITDFINSTILVLDEMKRRYNDDTSVLAALTTH